MFSSIKEDDLTDFIKSTIHKLGLTRKTYAGLRTLVRGIFKYGKSKKYTSISMTKFFGDLELPNNIFEKKVVNKNTEIFKEGEICIVISYLRSHADIWNLGLLLQFQTGMRVGEIAALKREDIQSDGTLPKLKLKGSFKKISEDFLNEPFNKLFYLQNIFTVECFDCGLASVNFQQSIGFCVVDIWS